jgi:hypothetical protein
MTEYAVYTDHPQFALVLEWLDHRRVPYDLHLNRTRFSISDPKILTECLLTFTDVIQPVDPTLDLATGLTLSQARRLGEL